MARAIFKSWFVDFEPVFAKTSGRRPSGISSEIASLFPNELTVSSLGPIPKGWSTGSILSIARLLSGGTPKTSIPEYWNGTIPWASAADVSQCQDCFLLKPDADNHAAWSETKCDQDDLCVVDGYCGSRSYDRSHVPFRVGYGDESDLLRAPVRIRVTLFPVLSGERGC